jgi:hypothetical protein
MHGRGAGADASSELLCRMGTCCKAHSDSGKRFERPQVHPADFLKCIDEIRHGGVFCLWGLA